MPQTIDTFAKDIHAVIEIPAKEVRLLKKAMSLCTNNGPLFAQEDKDAWEYFTDQFWPYVDQLDKDLNGSNGDREAGS
jgi:hypothetical protein